MKRAVGFLSIVVVPLFAASLAVGADRYGSESQGATSGTAAGAAAGFLGQHMMNGTVTDIDKDAGKVSLEAEGKELELHFPQSALQNLNKGDRVTVQMAIKKASGATSGAGAAPQGGTGSQGSGTRSGEPSGGMH